MFVLFSREILFETTWINMKVTIQGKMSVNERRNNEQPYLHRVTKTDTLMQIENRKFSEYDARYKDSSFSLGRMV